MSIDYQDRRVLHRFRAALTVELEQAGGKWRTPGTVHDISPCGAKIKTSLNLAIGTLCTVYFEVPEIAGVTRTIAVFAQCVHCDGDKIALCFDREQLGDTSVLFSALVDTGQADVSNPL